MANYERIATPAERKIWALWRLLPDDEPSPVKRIADALTMTPAEVAEVVYPAETFGAWDDSQEPDLPEGQHLPGNFPEWAGGQGLPE